MGNIAFDCKYLYVFTSVGLSQGQLCNIIQAKPAMQYIPSLQMYNLGCHTSHTMKIEAQSGQTINFTLIDLNEDDTHGLNCGIIVENSADHQLDLRLNQPRIGSTQSHSVSIIIDQNCNNRAFILGYQGDLTFCNASMSNCCFKFQKAL